MPSASKLLIPLALGAVAGIINWLVLTGSGGTTHRYVVARAPIAVGANLNGTNLDTKAFPASIGVAIPAADMNAIFGRKASRVYQPEDLLLRQDLLADQSLDLKPGQIAINVSLDGVQYESSLLRVGSTVGFVVPNQSDGPSTSGGQFDVLGPYRIVAIGSTTTPSQKVDGRQASTISVAVDFNSDDQTLNEAGDRLVRAKIDREIAAIAFYANDRSGRP